MEFGIHERLPIYSGGLGVLAGDHLKAAAELGVPLVGVGLLYTGGYFRQGVDKSGRQTEDYQPVDPEAVGLVREDVSVTVDLDGETIEAAVWRKDVAGRRHGAALPARGRLAHRRALRRRPRAPDPPGAPARVGGVRALAALGIEPNVFHLNEGHSASSSSSACAPSWRTAWRRTTRSSRSAAAPSSPRTLRFRPATRSSTSSSSSATSASSRPRPGSTRSASSSSAGSVTSRASA